MTYTIYKTLGNGLLSSWVADSLDPTHNYLFKMTASNQDGVSAESNVVSWGAARSSILPMLCPYNVKATQVQSNTYPSSLPAGVWVAKVDALSNAEVDGAYYGFNIYQYAGDWSGSPTCSIPVMAEGVRLIFYSDTMQIYPVYVHEAYESGCLLVMQQGSYATLYAMYQSDGSWTVTPVATPADTSQILVMEDGLLWLTTDGTTWNAYRPTNGVTRYSALSYDYNSPVVTTTQAPIPYGVNQYPVIYSYSTVNNQYQVNVLNNDYWQNGSVVSTTLNSGKPTMGPNYAVDAYTTLPWAPQSSPLLNLWTPWKVRALEPVNIAAVFEFHEVTSTAYPLTVTLGIGGTNPSGRSLTTVVSFHAHEGSLTGASAGGFHRMSALTQPNWLPALQFAGSYNWGDADAVRWVLDCRTSDGQTGKRYFCDLPVGSLPVQSSWTLFETTTAGVAQQVADPGLPADTGLLHYYPTIYQNQRVKSGHSDSVESVGGQTFRTLLTPGSYYIRNLNSAATYTITTDTGTLVHDLGSHPDSAMAFQVSAEAYYFIKVNGTGVMFDIIPFPTTQLMGLWDTDNAAMTQVTGWDGFYTCHERAYIYGTATTPNVTTAPGTPTDSTLKGYVNVHRMSNTGHTGWGDIYADVGNNLLTFTNGVCTAYDYISLGSRPTATLFDRPPQLTGSLLLLNTDPAVSCKATYGWFEISGGGEK